MATPTFHARELFYELQTLEARYWDEVDNNYGRNAHLYYAPDGVFTIGEKRFESREQVFGFYNWREERGDRTARHIISNLFLVTADLQHPVVKGVMFLYAADGKPVLESRPAILVADSTTAYGQAENGGWHILSRTLVPVFMGGVAPTLPS